jgi:glycerate kinase
LNAAEINRTVKHAILKVIPNAQIKAFNLADGGEGVLDALVAECGGKAISSQFTNLEHKRCTSSIGVIDDLCICECAQTVGLPQSDKLQIKKKTSQGIGEQIKFALDLGLRKFAIGLGGSGTNDAGVGMLAELGYQFADKQGNLVEPILANLAKIAQINANNRDKRLNDCQFTILSDVKNPLCGINGATSVYGLQKGVRQDQLQEIDHAIASFSQVATQYCGFDRAQEAGTGAAGGLGYAFLQFLNAQMVSGIDYVLNKINASRAFAEADLIITGEGQSDCQTANGKVAAGVAKLAKKFNKPVLLISGALSEDAYQLHEIGIDYLSSIQDYPATLQQVMQRGIAQNLLSHKIEETMRLLLIGKNLKGY